MKKLQQENRRLLRQQEGDGSDGNAYNSPFGKRFCARSNARAQLNKPYYNHIWLFTVSDDENGIVQRLQTALKESREALAAVRHEQEQGEKAVQKVDAFYATHAYITIRQASDEAEKYRRQAEEAQRQCSTMRHQGRLLVEERAQLQSQLQQIEEELIETRHRLGQTERAMIDSEQLKVIVYNRIDTHCFRLQNETGENKTDRPRFTLAELRHVLNERNELKARVLQLEEQIENMQAAANKPPVKECVNTMSSVF